MRVWYANSNVDAVRRVLNNAFLKRAAAVPLRERSDFKATRCGTRNIDLQRFRPRRVVEDAIDLGAAPLGGFAFAQIGETESARVSSAIAKKMSKQAERMFITLTPRCCSVLPRN